MSSREMNPETHNRNCFLFYNFQLDLSEKVKNHLFFKTHVERSSKKSK